MTRPYIVQDGQAYALDGGDLIVAVRMPDRSGWDWENATVWGRCDDPAKEARIRDLLAYEAATQDPQDGLYDDTENDAAHDARTEG